MKSALVGLLDKRWKLIGLYYRRLRARGVVNSLPVLKPKLILFHLRRVLLGETQGLSNFYVPSISQEDEIHFCCQILGCEKAAVEEVFQELELDEDFVEQLSRHYESVRADIPIPFSIGRFKTWYAIVRLLKPNIVLETGVHDGLSSTLILRAMSRNDRGCLVSIDLPALDLPIGVDGPGWLIPDDLKSRWRLNLGDAHQLLPVLARQHAPIDVFIHDSDHTAKFQKFEYQTVKPFLSTTGLLLTDDAIPALFSNIAQAWGTTAFLVQGAAPETGIILGGIRSTTWRPVQTPDDLRALSFS